MKKIFQIYLADLKRISTNVVAIVIIMGLGIIRLCMHGLILCPTGILTERKLHHRCT